MGKTIAFQGCDLTKRPFTFWIVEHSEAIGVMMTKELSLNDWLMLFNQIQVQLVEFTCEPWLSPFLLKEAWRDVANYVDLVENTQKYRISLQI